MASPSDTWGNIYTGPTPNSFTASSISAMGLPPGTIAAVQVKLFDSDDVAVNASDDVVFNIRIGGVDLFTTELTIADGTSEIRVTGLSEVTTNDVAAGLVIDAPFVSGALDGVAKISWQIEFVPTVASLASTTEVLTGTDSAKVVTPDAVAALWEQGSDVASGGTISLGEGGYFNITGTTTITDIDLATTKAGRKAWVKFAGILTLTHHGTNLILPTGANITTAAGDTACFISEGGDIVRCVAYNRASGASVLGGATLGDGDYGDVTVSSSGTVISIDAGVVGATELAAAVVPIGKQTIYIPASAMISATTNGAAAAQLETAGGQNYSVLDFDATTAESAHFQIAFPKGWNEGTVTFQPFWSSTATDTDGVAIGLEGVARSDNEAITASWGTQVIVTDDAQSAAAELYVGAESAAVTIGGSPAADDLCFFRVQRVVGDANDDMSEDMRLLGIKLFYTTDTANDA